MIQDESLIIPSKRYIYIDKFRFEMVGQDNIFQDGIYDDCLVLIEYACETAAMIL